VISRAGPFGRSGFPKPLDPPHLLDLLGSPSTLVVHPGGLTITVNG
jgi:hypothetical protein